MKTTISNSLIIFSFLLMVAGCTQNYYVKVHVPESNVIREEGKEYSSPFESMFNLPPDCINVADTLHIDTFQLIHLLPPKGTVFAN